MREGRIWKRKDEEKGVWRKILQIKATDEISRQSGDVKGGWEDSRGERR